MKALVYTLLACLLVSQLNGQQGKRHTCKCLDSGKTRMNPSLIHTVTVLKESNFCPHLEIVVKTKSRREVCVNPQSELGQKLIHMWESKKRNIATPPIAGTTQRQDPL